MSTSPVRPDAVPDAPERSAEALSVSAPEALSVSASEAGGWMPPGPVTDLLESAQAAVPDRPRRVLALAREALALAEETGDRLGHASALSYVGFGEYLLSQHGAALETLTRALAEAEPLGDLYVRSLALGALGSVHGSMGHYDEAQEIARENLRVARALGDHGREAWVLAMLANHLLDLGQTELAIRDGEEALRLFAELEDVSGQARAHTVVGGALRQRGRLAEARAHVESALRLAREAGAVLTEARALDDLGRISGAEGAHEAALELHHQALELREAVGNRQAEAGSRLRIGETLLALGRPDEALAALHQAYAIADAAGAEPRAAQADRALAQAYEELGDTAAALLHFRRYHERREALLDAQARSRVHTLQVRAEADRAIQEAELSRIRTEELGAANDELEGALRELQNAQRRMVQAEKLASLGRLSAGLAHEIQNPLNFVTNFSDLNADLALGLTEQIRDGVALDPAALADDLDTIASNARRIRDNARRADGIVRSLLGHVRDVGGEHRPVRLDALLDGAAAPILNRAPDVTVERRYAPGLPEVSAAPGSLQRAFTNIVDNAVQALRERAEGGVPGYTPTLTLSAEPYPGGVEVRIVDNGPGIPAEHCAYVFEPFFTTKPPGAGTGLGLSLAYDIVTEGHGGTLAVYSRVGEGATFTVSLPEA